MADPLDIWLAKSSLRQVSARYLDGRWRLDLLDADGRVAGTGRGDTFDEAAANSLNDVMARQWLDEEERGAA